MKKIILFFVFLSLIFFSCSKQKEIFFNYDLFSSNHYKEMGVKNKKSYLDSLYFETKQLSANQNLIDFLFNLSAEYYYLNDNYKSLIIAKDLLVKSTTIQDTLSIAKSNYFIGDAYEQEYKDSAYFYYQKAEKLYQLIGNDELRAKMLFNKSYILFFEGNYVESEILLSNALQLLKSGSNYELNYTVYNLMGCNLEKLDDYDTSLKYFNAAKSELAKLNHNDLSEHRLNDYEVTLSINTANIYDKKHDYDKSIQELKDLISNKISPKSPKNYVIALGNLGYSKMKSGNLEGVELLFKRALNLAYNSKNDTDIINKLIYLGEYYLIKKDTTKSRDYLNRALVLGNKIKASNELKLVYDLLSKAEPQRDSYYKGKIIRLTDSLAVVQRKNRNK